MNYGSHCIFPVLRILGTPRLPGQLNLETTHSLRTTETNFITSIKRLKIETSFMYTNRLWNRVQRTPSGAFTKLMQDFVSRSLTANHYTDFTASPYLEDMSAIKAISGKSWLANIWCIIRHVQSLHVYMTTPLGLAVDITMPDPEFLITIHCGSGVLFCFVLLTRKGIFGCFYLACIISPPYVMMARAA